jgi:predicted transcriptional regulator
MMKSKRKPSNYIPNDDTYEAIPSGGITVAELNRVLPYTKHTIRRHLQELVDEGLVWREHPPHIGRPKHKGDKKSVFYIRHDRTY